MKRLHVHVAADDLATSRRFFRTVSTKLREMAPLDGSTFDRPAAG